MAREPHRVHQGSRSSRAVQLRAFRKGYDEIAPVRPVCRRLCVFHMFFSAGALRLTGEAKWPRSVRAVRLQRAASRLAFFGMAAPFRELVAGERKLLGLVASTAASAPSSRFSHRDSNGTCPLRCNMGVLRLSRWAAAPGTRHPPREPLCADFSPAARCASLQRPGGRLAWREKLAYQLTQVSCEGAHARRSKASSRAPSPAQARTALSAGRAFPAADVVRISFEGELGRRLRAPDKPTCR